MSTTAVAPVAPTPLKESQGKAMAILQQKQRQLATQLKVEGTIKPAVILNLSPFVLKIENGSIPYAIPACPKGKDFHAEMKSTPRFFTQYERAVDAGGGQMMQEFKSDYISPVKQLVEFYNVYNGVSGHMEPQGGVVVFEGDRAKLKLYLERKEKVHVPQIEFVDGRSYQTFREEWLPDLIAKAKEIMRTACMRKLNEASDYSTDPAKIKNITVDYHLWAHLALDNEWITALPDWKGEDVMSKDLCVKCGERNKSKTGVCRCSHVYDPMLAYMEHEIHIDHVSMGRLTAEQWKAVRKEETRRAEARGEKAK